MNLALVAGLTFGGETTGMVAGHEAAFWLLGVSMILFVFAAYLGRFPQPSLISE